MNIPVGKRLFVFGAAAMVAAALFIGPVSPAFSVGHYLAEGPALELGAADTSSQVTWSLQPATADTPDGRISLRHVVDPSTTVLDQLLLSNFSDTPATFAVYAGEGVMTPNGDFDLRRADEKGTGAGGWVSLGPVDGTTTIDDGTLVVSVPPSGRVSIPVTVAVPADATPGDHPVGIVAELVPDDAEVMQMASRVGVRLHLRVSGEVVPQLVVREVRSAFLPSWNPFAPGILSVEYSIVNSGNIRLGVSDTVAAAGLFGAFPQEKSNARREILPGESLPARVEILLWPTGFIWGEVIAEPQVVGADGVDTALVTSATSFSAWAIPWAQLSAMVVLVVMVLLIRRQRHVSQARIQARIATAVAAARAAGDPPVSAPMLEEVVDGDPRSPAT